jgi:hypothetical protein
MSRGVEVLRLKGGASASAKLRTVQAPEAEVDPLAAVPVSSLEADALVCPLFEVPAAGR